MSKLKSVKLGAICNPKQWKTIATDKFIDKGYPVYGANGKIGFYSEYTHTKETLLVTCRGATCGSLNVCEPYSYVNGNAMALDNLSDEIHLRYLYYFLSNRGFADVISGSAQPQIIRSTLQNIDVLIPPLEEQKKIAEILDKASNFIFLRKKQIEKLDLLVKAKFVEMFGDLVLNPMGWDKGIIRDVVCEVSYGTSKPAVENGRYTYLRMNNITYDGHLDLSNLKYIDMTNLELTKYTVKKGDILFNRTNSKELVGKTCVFREDEPMVIAGYIIRVRTNNRANPEYVSAILNSAYGKKTLYEMCKAIVGQANINAQELQDIKILIPPIKLQTQFASFVQQVEQQKAQLQQGLEKLELNYKALMQQYFG